MRADLLRLAADLAGRGEPFALVTVVRREPPSSARVGDCALVTAGGSYRGWLGGSCTQPTAVRIARQALRERRPLLVALHPTPDAVHRPGVTVLPMTCHSGGSVDLFVEPMLPAPRLMVFGVSPAAQAVARIAAVLGYAVDAVDPEADRSAFPEADRIITATGPDALRSPSGQPYNRLYAVVATLGDRDEAAVEAALSLEPAYLGLVASRKRFAELRATLAGRGVPDDALDGVASPAGLDIGAVSPGEIALSVLAEIVTVDRRGAVEPAVTATGVPDEAVDPVCGMTVATTTAHRAEHAGRTYYFCCGSCRERFAAAPASFITADVGDESA